MKLEMKVASKFAEPFNVVYDIHDLEVNDISTILGSYYSPGTGLQEKMSNLCGPPKLLYWFILSAQKFKLESVSDLEKQWDEIEDMALGLYREQIQSTVKSFGIPPEELGIFARNFCLLHTHAFINNTSGYLEFEELPNNWTPFIESGLIRTRQIGSRWKLFPPNRFLIKIFHKYVKWFTWENIQDLVANIKASVSSESLKGKVFEHW